MQVARVAPGRPVPSLMHGRRVMAETITYVGLDVHMETIAVALAAAGKRGEVREYGTIVDTPTALKALAGKLAKPGCRRANTPRRRAPPAPRRRGAASSCPSSMRV